MKNVINKFGSIFIVAVIAITVSCDPENITTKTYSFPDVYVALIRVSPTEIVPLSDITIEGNDLDHVKAVRFWNGEGELDIAKTEFKEHTKEKIVLNVPEDAPLGVDNDGKPKGKVSIITNEDKIITWLNNVTDKLIAIMSVTPETVAEGDMITLEGKNLEFVKAVRFTKGSATMVVPAGDFHSFSPDNGVIELVIPEGAPVEKLSVITDYDQIIFWEGAFAERSLTVIEASPDGGTVVVGTDITFRVTNADLVKSVAFGTVQVFFTVVEEDEEGEEQEGTLLTVTIPNTIDVGVYPLNIATWNGVVKVADYDIVRLFLDPVWDISHIYFDFDEKGSWWGDCPQTIADDPDYSISGSYFHIEATAAPDWYGLFWRNSGNGLNISGVTVDNWVVKYDINVLGPAIASLKIRLGDFWFITDVNPNIGGWYTITAPLNAFKDNNGNGRAMTDTDLAAMASGGDFGMADGGAGGEYNALIDNIRFESLTPYYDPVADPAYVYFDFDGKGSWWGWDAGFSIENDPLNAISGNYARLKGIASAGWEGFFWRNSGNDLNVSGVTVDDWVVKYDINVLGPNVTSIKIRLGDFWFTTGVLPNIGGWYTYMAPLSGFKDNEGKGNPMTDEDVAAMASGGDFGMADGGAGGEYNVLIDNVRFEPK